MDYLKNQTITNVKEQIKIQEDVCLLLIDMYKHYSLLWNPNHINYYNEKLKTDAWRNIAQQMKLSEEICRSQINSLLESFRIERAKMERYEDPEEDVCEIYRSRWFAYDAFEFLSETDMKRSFEMSFQDEKEIPITSISDIEETDPLADTPPKQQKLSKDEIHITKNVLEVKQDSADKKGNCNNDITSFAHYISSKMKSYPPPLNKWVEHAMLEIIMKADNGFREPQNNQTQFRPEYYGTYLNQLHSPQLCFNNWIPTYELQNYPTPPIRMPVQPSPPNCPNQQRFPFTSYISNFQPQNHINKKS